VNGVGSARVEERDGGRRGRDAVLAEERVGVLAEKVEETRERRKRAERVILRKVKEGERMVVEERRVRDALGERVQLVESTRRYSG
jgi:hypothetical protein